MWLGNAEVSAMIRINLLPHREEKRKQRRQSFLAMLVLCVLLGGIVVMIIGAVIANNISTQSARNAVIKAANAKLDEEIKEIASLKQEIDALKARQQAVEDLQSDRNQPVHLLDELVKQVPEGVYLRSFKQEAQRVVLNGYAQSNERVSELLRNLSNNSPWLERPDLIEIRSTGIGQGKDAKKVFEFTINVGIKRERTKEAVAGAPAAAGVAGAEGAVAANSSGTQKVTTTVTTTTVPAATASPSAPNASASATQK
jgi:type IV pilus assembly protein PilN